MVDRRHGNFATKAEAPGSNPGRSNKFFFVELMCIIVQISVFFLLTKRNATKRVSKNEGKMNKLLLVLSTIKE